MSTYLFDFDGTLADSMPFFAEGVLALLREHHIAYPGDIIKTITPLGYTGTAKYCAEHLGIPLSVDSFVDMLHESLFPAYRDKVLLKQGVVDCLVSLKKDGHSLNVLSASPCKMIRAVLTRCGVIDLFNNIWSCEDFHMTKGDPEIYRLAVERAGGELADTVFFDDNLQVLKTAVKTGMHTVGVYDASSADYVDDIKKTVDRFIYTFAEIGGL